MNAAGLSALIRATIGDLAQPAPVSVPLRRPPRGDAHWSTSVALSVGADDPDVLARVLGERLRAQPGIANVTVSPPGFVDITLDVAELAAVARQIVLDGAVGGAVEGATVHDHGGEAGRDHAQMHPSDDDVRVVRFTHGRLSNLARQAADHGVDRSAFVPELLSHRSEIELLLALAEADDVIQSGDPGRVLHHLTVVADRFGTCFGSTRLTPRGLDPVTDLHRTRLWLSEATRMTLASGLHRLGLTAPEHI